MKTIGIIGGLGPETTAEFYLDLVKECRKSNAESYPSIVIHNIPLPFLLENNAILYGQKSDLDKQLSYLLESARLLEKAGADFGVIPCNTVHIYIDEIRKSVRMPFLSIIEATVEFARAKNWKKIALLGTKATITSGIYDKEFGSHSIEILKPNFEDQESLSEIILHILRGEKSMQDKETVLRIVKKLEAEGAEAVILGCTDFQLLLNEKDFDIPIVDTVEVLVKKSAETILSSAYLDRVIEKEFIEHVPNSSVRSA